MNKLNNAKFADMANYALLMIYVYDAKDRNARPAARMYLVLPKHTSDKWCFFGQLHRRFYETGAFQLRNYIGQERITRTPVVEETVPKKFDWNAQVSLWTRKRVLVAYCSSIMRILHKATTIPFTEYRCCTLTIISKALHLHPNICNNVSHSWIFLRSICFRTNLVLHRAAF